MDTFRLHPCLDPDDYRITDSLRDIPRWRAKVHLANSASTDTVGKMDHVGYVMISLDDNTIIPIARDDEHNLGWDLVHELSDKTPISQDFMPVWTGNNYIGYHKDDKLNTEAYRRFLAYGGHDGIVHFGLYERPTGMTTMSDFVQNGMANGSPRKGTLAPLGQKVISAFKKVSDFATLELKREQQGMPIRIAGLYLASVELAKVLEHVVSPYNISHSDAASFTKELKGHRRDTSTKWFMDAIFGFHGIKNKVHMKMKAEMSFESWVEKREAFWGDLELAINLLADM